MKNFILSLCALATIAISCSTVSAGNVRGDYGTAASGAATLNKQSGTITSEALTTAAGAAYTLTLTCDRVKDADSIVVATVDQGTNTTTGVEIGRITPAAGTATILVWNRHASAALNGTIKIRYFVLKS
jgi:hypothetical protein